MTRKKPYDDGCAAAHALDLVGERWALLIVRELIAGPKRFSDLKAALKGVSTNILTIRLGELEAGAVLARRILPPPASAQVYQLTEWGAALEPIIRDLGRWGARSPTLEPGKPMTAASLMLSFRTMFDSDKARDFDATLEIVMSGTPHRVRIRDGAIEIAPGVVDDADVVLAGATDLIAAYVYAGLTLEEAEAQGLKVDGKRLVAKKFAKLFPLPDTAPGCAIV